MNKVIAIVNAQTLIAFVTTNDKHTSANMETIHESYKANYTHAKPTQAHCKQQMLALTSDRNTTIVQHGNCNSDRATLANARAQLIAQYTANGYTVLNIK